MTICKMPKKRLSENKGLPEGWRLKNGAYRYRVPIGMEHKWGNKKEFTLGKNLSEAYGEWAKRMETLDEAKTINDLLDRYALEIVPNKAVSTAYLNKLYLNNLRPAFGHMKIEDIEPIHIYQYLDKRGKKKTENGKTRGGISAAKREVAMFSDVFTKAIKWGVIKSHPFKGMIEFETEKGRDRYVENWELNEFLSLVPKRKKDPTLMIQAYCGLKVLTGLRQQDLLCMKPSDFKEDGIDVTVRKTGKQITIEWTPALRQAVAYALSVRPVHISQYLFCTRRGESYYDETKPDSSSGFKSIWKRYMDRALEETKLTEAFTEHDLRAKTASDLNDIEHAQKLLAHSSQNMTRRYMRKRELVRPAR